jgi:hypothetical protein
MPGGDKPTSANSEESQGASAAIHKTLVIPHFWDWSQPTKITVEPGGSRPKPRFSYKHGRIFAEVFDGLRNSPFHANASTPDK